MGKPDFDALNGMKIVITGGAGLVGQNLVIKLLASGCDSIQVIDKSVDNLAVGARLHPDVSFTEADLSVSGEWRETVAQADVIVILHAQIGGIVADAFRRNNVTATENVLAAASRSAYLVHVSSSVIESSANDEYTATKAIQEDLIVNSGLPYTVLRPTLMFGWFDRKHLGWLSQFMSTSPVFPIPGDGHYIRQPLYAGDFTEIILACIKQRPPPASYNISGKEKISYIDIIRKIKSAKASRCLLLKIPYSLFYFLLTVYAWFDRDPPFTTSQLQALVIDEVFEDIDWETIFAVRATALDQAIRDTFTHSVYSKIRLKF
jgi:nucleoside-diphosphate-sugar epimerase